MQQLRIYERQTANAGLSKLHGLRHQLEALLEDPGQPLDEFIEHTRELHEQFITVVKRGRGERLKAGDELFSGYPVAFVLGGIAILFGGFGILLDVFHPIQFFNLLPRVWGAAASNPVRWHRSVGGVALRRLRTVDFLGAA